jgi:hypothetical protein
MTLFAEYIPEDHRVALKAEAGQAELFHPFGHLRILTARKGEAGEVSLYIGHEDGNAKAAELLGHYPQGHGLACARCPGDKAMAIGHFRNDANLALSLGDWKRWRCAGHFPLLKKCKNALLYKAKTTAVNEFGALAHPQFSLMSKTFWYSK